MSAAQPLLLELFTEELPPEGPEPAGARPSPTALRPGCKAAGCWPAAMP
jgi:hypothetical protein